jgi:hypothetical protein
MKGPVFHGIKNLGDELSKFGAGLLPNELGEVHSTWDFLVLVSSTVLAFVFLLIRRHMRCQTLTGHNFLSLE